MNPDRIPSFANHSPAGMTRWFDEMSLRGLLFHPQDRAEDIIRIATGKKLFTTAECEKLDRILDQMVETFGDARVCEAAYPVFMKAAGLPISSSA